VLTELATAATLVNPYGIDLLLNAFTFPSNPNLGDVLEWSKLSLVSTEGLLFSFSWILMVILLRYSRRPVRPADIILLVVFNYAVVMSIRMMSWYAVVYVTAMIPHIADIASRIWPPRSSRRSPKTSPPSYESSPPPYESSPPSSETPSPPYEGGAKGGSAGGSATSPATSPASALATVSNNSNVVSTQLPAKAGLFGPTYIHTVVCALIVWYGIAFSPSGNQILGGKPTPDDKLYSKMTPRELTRFLRESPPAGQIWNPQWWGDWLVWDGPPNLQVFMTTNAVHLAPRRLWNDYLRVARAQFGWEEILDRYRVSTVIVHKELQKRLAEEVRDLAGWEIIYEDELAIVIARESRKKKLSDADLAGTN
jgi:hypothetical protein